MSIPGQELKPDCVAAVFAGFPSARQGMLPAIYHCQQGRYQQQIGRQGEKYRASDQHPEIRITGQIGGGVDNKPAEKNQAGNHQRPTGVIKGFSHGSFHAAIDFVCPAEMVQEMNRIVNNQPQDDTADENGHQVDGNIHDSHDTKNQDDWHDIGDHAHQSDAQPPDHDHHQGR